MSTEQSYHPYSQRYLCHSHDKNRTKYRLMYHKFSWYTATRPTLMSVSQTLRCSPRLRLSVDWPVIQEINVRLETSGERSAPGIVNRLNLLQSPHALYCCYTRMTGNPSTSHNAVIGNWGILACAHLLQTWYATVWLCGRCSLLMIGGLVNLACHYHSIHFGTCL